MVLINAVWAESAEGIINFRKIGLFHPEDRTGQQYGEIVGRQIRSELEGTFRFEIIPQQQLSKELPMPTPALIDLGKRFELDGIITGAVEINEDSMKISLTLMDAKRGDPFAKEFITVRDWKKSEAVEVEVRAIVAKLMSRIPYQAVVTDVQGQGEAITVSAGKLQGLGNGMTLQVIDIAKVKRHPFTQEVIGVDPVDVGELIVTRADERMSVAKPVRPKNGRVFARGQFVVFKPSAKVMAEMAPRREELIAQKKGETAALEEAALRERRAKLPNGSLALAAGAAWANFSLNSDQLEFERKISAFPLVAVSGEYWAIRSIGLDVSYQKGFVKLDRQDNTSIDVRARPSWLAFHLNYRYILRPAETHLQLIGHFGYASYTFQVTKTDPQFLSRVSYRGPSIGIEGRFPLASKMTADIGIDYQPVLKIDERPVNSGENPSSWSIGLHAEGRYRLHSGFWLSIQYLFKDFIASYSRPGSRAGGVTGARTRDDLNTVMFGLVAEF